jgi:acyl carrier protein
MKKEAKNIILNYLQERLLEMGQPSTLLEDESLFLSGKMDSLSAVYFLLFLEEQFPRQMSNFEFDIEKIDSVVAVLDFLVIKK